VTAAVVGDIRTLDAVGYRDEFGSLNQFSRTQGKSATTTTICTSHTGATAPRFPAVLPKLTPDARVDKELGCATTTVWGSSMASTGSQPAQESMMLPICRRAPGFPKI
jgi:hypothetical protein